MSEGKTPLSFAIDFALGGISGAVAKTMTAPIERVKLIIQTQDANPRIRSGEVPRYTGIINCFSRVASEQGFLAFWRGNFTNVIRYFPTQAFNFAFKDTIKTVFPKYNPKTQFGMFFAVQMASGGLAGAGSLCIVYPLDYARTRLASDVGTGKRDFNGLFDCLVKTSKGPKGPLALYNGFVSLLPELFLTEESISDCTILSEKKIPTKMTMVPWDSPQNSSSLKVLPSVLVMRHIHSIPFVVVFKCNPRNPKNNGFTKELPIA